MGCTRAFSLEGTPIVLKNLAPRLPKEDPPWGIEGEPEGRQIFNSKRPVEVKNERNDEGHIDHKKVPSHEKLHQPKQHLKHQRTIYLGAAPITTTCH